MNPRKVVQALAVLIIAALLVVMAAAASGCQKQDVVGEVIDKQEHEFRFKPNEDRAQFDEVIVKQYWLFLKLPDGTIHTHALTDRRQWEAIPLHSKWRTP